MKIHFKIFLALVAMAAASAAIFLTVSPLGAINTTAPMQVLNAPPFPALGASAPIPVNAPARAAISVRATGNLVSLNQATLAFQTAGRIKEIRVKQGERVRAGTILASLDTTGLDAQVAAAQANYDRVKAGPVAEEVQIAKTALDRAKAAVEQAQAAYDRIGGSSNSGIAATTQALALQQATFSVQEAIARYNLAVNHPTAQELTAAAATLETAKVAAANARLVAPFDSTVLWIGVRANESVAVGAAAVAVADMTRMQLLLNVDEVSAATLQAGQPATVTVDAFPGRQFKGRVASVALFGITGGALITVPVLVDIDPSTIAIFPGLSATAEIQGVTP